MPPLALLVDGRTGFDPGGPASGGSSTALQSHVQGLVDTSEATREEFYFFAAEPGLRPGKWSTEKEHPVLDPANFIERSATWRTRFEEELIGVFDEERLPPNPRTRTLRETDAWTMLEVGLDRVSRVRSLGSPPPAERPETGRAASRRRLPARPPRSSPRLHRRGKSAYNDFAARLAERGYITYSPTISTGTRTANRWLDRKANQIGATLFTFIVASHRQHLDWLASLPQVDPERIAFYGLSYGGETAVRVPSVIPDYCLSICSGDFNHWTRKVADPDFPRRIHEEHRVGDALLEPREHLRQRRDGRVESSAPPSSSNAATTTSSPPIPGSPMSTPASATSTPASASPTAPGSSSSTAATRSTAWARSNSSTGI